MTKSQINDEADGPTEPETCSIVEAGRRVGLGKDASYQAAHAGKLPVMWFGKKGRVSLPALKRMIETGKLPE